MILLMLLCAQAVDAFGDPLPEGAVARLGTVRWRHGGYVLSVAFSPDGRRILSGSESVALWDLQTGLRIRTFAGTSPVAFVDADRAISAMSGGSLALWDLSTGRLLRDFKGATGWIGSIAVDPKGRFALAGGMDKTVRKWNLETGACEWTREQNSPLHSLALSRDGRAAVTSTWKEPPTLWEVETGKAIRTFEGGEDGVRSVLFTPDGLRFIVDRMDGKVEVRDVESGRVICSREGDRGRVEGTSVSPDGKLALSPGSLSTLKLWELDTGKTVRVFEGHRWTVFSASFSPDGRMAASGAGDATIGLWDVATGKRLNVFDTHDSEVLSGAFTPDGRHALTTGQDQTVSVWDWAAGKRVRTVGPTDGTAWALAIAPDGKSCFVANGSSVLRWSLDPGRREQTFKVDSGGVYSVAVSPDGKSFLCGGNRLHLWDSAAGRELKGFSGTNGFGPVAFVPDRRHVLAGHGKHLTTWRIDTGEAAGVLDGPDHTLQAIAVSPDGRFALAGGDDGKAVLWDLALDRREKEFSGHDAGIRSIALGPDATVFASGGYDKAVILWDIASGERLAVLRGHLGTVHSIAFSPSGAEILSTSGDTSALVWRPSMKHREAARALGVKEALDRIESPDFEQWCQAREAFRLLGDEGIRPLLQRYPPQPADPLSDQAKRELEERLENDDQEIRRKAREELKALGRSQLPWILARLAGGARGELRAALQEAREAIERTTFRTNDRGRIRAVLLLIEALPGNAAREALEKYSEGPVDSYPAELARRALLPGK